MNLEKLKNIIQSCNINFIVGSGLSRPYLITLGNIELLLEQLDQNEEIEEIEKHLIKASIYKKYFEEVMVKNLDSYKQVKNKDKDEEEEYKEVIGNYKTFLQSINSILLYRYIPIHGKQINVFTTNIDLFFEKALESTKIEFNDGFQGRLSPIFNLSNFQKSYKKTSLHYKNTSEIPVFNLLKLHGSINWKKYNNQISLSLYEEFESIEKSLSDLTDNVFLRITDKNTLNELVKDAKKITDDFKGKKLTELNEKLLIFLNEYEKLQIVNPTKEKFKTTLLNTTYYELLRLFANEMEKENTILFALGFSFADEHIREITLRAVNSNPTLQLYVIAFDEQAKNDIEQALGFHHNRILNGNVKVIDPTSFLEANTKDDEVSAFENFNFKNINTKIFEIISKRVNPMIGKDGK